MPDRKADESQYWDNVANAHRYHIYDNVHKRIEIVRRVLAYNPINQRILEIGIGNGLAIGAILGCTLGNLIYRATDVSQVFVDRAKENLDVDVTCTDITSLPDGPYDQIWAFDTLEHVHPDDRSAGYLEISRVLDKHGLVLINNPTDESGHDSMFDHGFNHFDLAQLCDRSNLKLAHAELYQTVGKTGAVGYRYQFIVLGR